ncbi:helix-turn-helix domain-containing protein [Spirosoma sp. KNUC1025]|uniref:helix-turn-helix domain-containing protein n=1 Tax=Spirosoma sp. KNUC1025 TaxID=2894082 RepID=UPI00386E9876|nr:helix-turn-helix domain-containing protein [Spirosoma sp. KNUC1025]
MINPFEELARQLATIQEQNKEILSQLNKTPLAPDEVGGKALAQQITGLSEAYIYSLVSKRLIPHQKRGNRLYFKRSELLAWITEGNREPKEGI